MQNKSLFIEGKNKLEEEYLAAKKLPFRSLLLIKQDNKEQDTK